MNIEQKRAIAREMLENMDLTKEQYIEMCRMIDELHLVPKGDEPLNPEEMDWDDILEGSGD